MQYSFVEFVKNLNWYAVIDAVVLIAIIVLLVLFFAYKRNIKVLLLLLSALILEVLISVLAELYDYKILTLARYMLHYVVLTNIIITCVVYQNDFKTIFQKVSTTKSLSETKNSADELQNATTEILTACQDMAKQDVGAIIIIDTAGDIHENILDTGTRLGATLSAPLLESIFNTKAPLHDGAVIVRGNKIIAAGCFLTLTQRKRQ